MNSLRLTAISASVLTLLLIPRTATAQGSISVDVSYSTMSKGCHESVTGRFAIQTEMSWPQLIQALSSGSDLSLGGVGVITLTRAGCESDGTFSGGGPNLPVGPFLRICQGYHDDGPCSLTAYQEASTPYVLITGFSLNSENTCSNGCGVGFSSSSLQTSASTITGPGGSSPSSFSGTEEVSGGITIRVAGSSESGSQSNADATSSNPPIAVSVPKVVDFGNPEMQKDGSHVVNFNRQPPVTTMSPQTNPNGAKPDTLLATDNIPAVGGAAQALVQSLTAALDQQLNDAAPSVQQSTDVDGAQRFLANLVNGAPEWLLKEGAQQLGNSMDVREFPSDPIDEGAGAVAGQLSGQLVDKLTDALDTLAVDQNALNIPATNALFQIDRAMNPFNLRKGTYEYTKGITEALTNALDFFFPPNQ